MGAAKVFRYLLGRTPRTGLAVQLIEVSGSHEQAERWQARHSR